MDVQESSTDFECIEMKSTRQKKYVQTSPLKSRSKIRCNNYAINNRLFEQNNRTRESHTDPLHIPDAEPLVRDTLLIEPSQLHHRLTQTSLKNFKVARKNVKHKLEYKQSEKRQHITLTQTISAKIKQAVLPKNKQTALKKILKQTALKKSP